MSSKSRGLKLLSLRFQNLKLFLQVKFKVCGVYTHGADVKGQIGYSLYTKQRTGTYWNAPVKTIEVSGVKEDVEGCEDITFTKEDIQKYEWHFCNFVKSFTVYVF